MALCGQTSEANPLLAAAVTRGSLLYTVRDGFAERESGRERKTNHFTRFAHV